MTKNMESKYITNLYVFFKNHSEIYFSCILFVCILKSTFYFCDHSAPRAFPISDSDLPIPTAISTRALEIASLVPSYISSGVIGIPSLYAIPVTLSRFGLALKAEVNLWREAYAFIRPWS